MKMTTSKFRLMYIAAIAVTPVLAAAAHPGAAPAATTPTNAERSAPVAPETAVGTVNAFHEALKRNDTMTALALLSDDVIIFESGGVEKSRAEYAAHHLKADAEFSAGTSRTPVSQNISNTADMATVMRVELVKGSFRGRPVNSRSVETMMLSKTKAGWRIGHIHWSSADIKK